MREDDDEDEIKKDEDDDECWRRATTRSPLLLPVAFQSHLSTHLLSEDVSVATENLKVKMQNSL